MRRKLSFFGHTIREGHGRRVRAGEDCDPGERLWEATTKNTNRGRDHDRLRRLVRDAEREADYHF